MDVAAASLSRARAKKKVRLGRVRTGAHIVDQKTHDHSFPNEALISQLESGALDHSAKVTDLFHHLLLLFMLQKKVGKSKSIFRFFFYRRKNDKEL